MPVKGRLSGHGEIRAFSTWAAARGRRVLGRAGTPASQRRVGFRRRGVAADTSTARSASYPGS